MYYKLLLGLLFLFSIFVFFKIFNLIKFFYIEKWIGYLNYVADEAFETIYMTRLTVWVANKTMPSLEDKEFLEISQQFLNDVYVNLGKMKKFYYTLFTKDQLREYLLLYFITKVHETAGKQAIELSVQDLKEQTK